MKKTNPFLPLRQLLPAAFLLLSNAVFGQTTATLFGGLKARQIGPAVMSGRVTDIDAVASDPKIFYVASAGGGLWKTENGGGNFSPVFDDHTQSIGKVTIDQARPDTVWAGTGESWVRNSVSVGTGIYRTVNGGKTWEFKGLEKSERIADIEIDPKDPNTVYVACQGHLWNANEERGVYKTTDGGNTWTRVLFVDANTGCADLAMDPSDPKVLYAAMWDHRRYPDFFVSGGKGSGLYKSVDGGATWKTVHEGLPPAPYGRFGIGIAPNSPQTLYLSVEVEGKDGKGLYRSDNGGGSWAKVNDEFNTKVRPFYFSRIVVDPTDHRRVFKCGLNLIMSTDGGNSFTGVGIGVHSDIHAVWVDPGNPDHVLIGTDGGAYRSLDGGRTCFMFMNLPLSQFYHVALDMEEPYNIYGGLQDNGSWFAPSASPSGIENADWKLSCYGDGFWSFPHPADDNVVFSESQGGNLVRFYKDDGCTKDIKPLPAANEPAYRFNWNAPIHFSPTDPERMYFGAQYLFVTTNRGDTWQTISPDLTTNDPARQRKESGGLSPDKSSAENNTTIYTIAESPKNAQQIWVGTDDGNVQMTADGGKKWNNVSPAIGAPAFTWVSDVEPSPHDANTCFVALDGHRTGDMTPYLYKTADLGKTWTSLVTPDLQGYVFCVKQDPVQPELLFAGTEFGLYISLDGGASWARFANDFPKVAVHDMAIHPRDHALVCATHGRGVIVLDDISPLRALTPEILAKEIHLLPSKPGIVRYRPAGNPFDGAGNFIGPNPDDAVQLVYYLKKRHTFGKMEVQVFDAAGKMVRTLTPGKSAGLNFVPISLRLPMPKSAPTNNRQALGSSIFGPTLPDGTYTVKLIKGKEEFSTTVSVAHEPETRYPATERQQQHETLMILYDLSQRLGHCYYALEDIHKPLEAETGDKTAIGIAQKARSLKESIVSLEGDFYIDEGENLRERLSMLYGSVSRFPGRPTDGQLRQTQDIRKDVQEVLRSFEAIKKQFDDWNAKRTAAGKPTVPVRTWEEYIK